MATLPARDDREGAGSLSRPLTEVDASPHTPRRVARPEIGATLISARSLAEYRVMFCLGDQDLSGRILDCPGGAASFAVEVAAKGAQVSAVDPIYAADRDWLSGHGVQEALRGNLHTAAAADSYVWEFFRDPDDHREKRLRSARQFGADLLATPDRYIAAALPHLPFPDAAFDVVLSSHLLFMYADRLDEDFHLQALLEMVRVSAGEVRVFPLLADSGDPLTSLKNRLVTSLTSWGVAVDVLDSDYEFQQGGTQMWVLHSA